MARKGPEKIAHFGHSARSACGGGPETALHLLAKQILADKLTLLLPAMVSSHNGIEQHLRDARLFIFDRALIETPLKDMPSAAKGMLIPDLFLYKEERRLMVEIHVTNPCGEEKIARLREQDIAAIEIDLSRVPRDAPPAAIEDAVLYSAPRRWVFHREIEAAVAEFIAAADRRMAREHAQREIAACKREAELDELARLYQAGLAALEKVKCPTPEPAHILSRAELLSCIGRKVNGYGCFAVSPAVWQIALLCDFLEGRYEAGGRPAAMKDDLLQKGFIRPRFRFVSKANEAALKSRQPGFAAPFGAIEAYLADLVRLGILAQSGASYVLSRTVQQRVHRLQEADQRRQQRTEDIDRRTRVLLESLPSEDKIGFSFERWFGEHVTEFGMSFAAAIAADGDEIRRMMSALSSIETMMLTRGPIVAHTLGLPIETQRECLRELRRLEAEEREAERARIANEARRCRLDSLEKAASGSLPSQDVASWLNEPDSSGQSPADRAWRSASGLDDALFALRSELDRRQRAQAEQQRIYIWREKLRRAVEQAMGAQKAQIFCNGTHPRLGNRRPIEYCVDEGTLDTCIALFTRRPRRR